MYQTPAPYICNKYIDFVLNLSILYIYIHTFTENWVLINTSLIETEGMHSCVCVQLCVCGVCSFVCLCLTFFCRLLTRSKARLARYSPYTWVTQNRHEAAITPFCVVDRIFESTTLVLQRPNQPSVLSSATYRFLKAKLSHFLRNRNIFHPIIG